jgi:NAD(P)H-hydrate epimerase
VKLVSVDEMRELDRRTIEEAGVPGKVLMYRAGTGAGEIILSYFSSLPPVHRKRYVLLAGKGNNGGDAYVIADFLKKHTGADVVVYAVVPPENLSGDALFYAEKIKGGIKVICGEVPRLRKGDIIIDGLLGTGIKGALREPYSTWIKTVNASHLPVAAIDIPSGLNGDDGTVSPFAVKADITITMAYPKLGFVKAAGPEHCGVIKCVDIGIPEKFTDEISVADRPQMIMEQDISCLTRRDFDAYKYKCGRVVIIAGSYRYPGAAMLAAESALASGAGLVNLIVPESAGIPFPDSKSIVFTRVPDFGNGCFSEISAQHVNSVIENADAVLTGPGLSLCEETVDFFRNLNFKKRNNVFDADALNIIAELFAENKNYTLPAGAILTPHKGELIRIKNALNLAPETLPSKMTGMLGCFLIDKGPQTKIISPDGKIFVNSNGTPALASAGTGDVLAGLLTGLLGQGIEPLTAACSAVFIHGLTPETAGKGIRAFTADTALSEIASAMRIISPFA